MDKVGGGSEVERQILVALPFYFTHLALPLHVKKKKIYIDCPYAPLPYHLK